MFDAFSYSSLEDEYNQFADPVATIIVGETDIRGNKGGVALSEVEVDLTSGFEAGQAAFSLYDCYDLINSTFEYDKIKNFIILGEKVKVSLGYSGTVREVFRGVIVRVEFVVEDTDAPHVRVTAMDIKGIMMANHYHKKLLSDSYSGAVKEIFKQDVYLGMTNPTGVISKLSISDTPDASPLSGGGETAKTIEMVGESDYEFVVKAAKKWNFEFFCVGGQVLFREARSDTTTLITLKNTTKLFSMNVTYDITGLVQNVCVRGLDAGAAKVIEGNSRNSNKISSKPNAKNLISGSEYVYTDPTVDSKLDAMRRSWYLSDTMNYRFGNLDMEIMGLPEIIPGRFIDVDGYGTAVSNTFYVTGVKHHMDKSGRYITRILGKAQSLQTDLSSLL